MNIKFHENSLGASRVVKRQKTECEKLISTFLQVVVENAPEKRGIKTEH
jgi:hypothetical protein